MQIIPIKAFSDNYIWLIRIDSKAIVVDPGESKAVIDYLKEEELDLQAILLTHEHDDHIAGVEDILTFYPDLSVYGPVETQDLADQIVHHDDQFTILGQDFRVFKTAGHTHEHISYLMGQDLFCGDALFSAGCGRVFTGDYQAQYDSMQFFASLADETRIYPGHEYTLTNLQFAHTIRPADQAIADELKTVEDLRAHDQITLPSTIEKEKKINVFIQTESLEEFKELRDARDQF